MLKDMDFCHLQENIIKKQLLDTGLDAPNTFSRKVVHKAADGLFIGIKISDKIVKPKHVINENLGNFEEIIILPEKREEISSELSRYFKNGTL